MIQTIYALLFFIASNVVSAQERQDETTDGIECLCDISYPVCNHRILHIGDSQVAGPYGELLGNYLMDHNAQYYRSVGRQGWSTRRWLQNKRLIQTYVERIRPTLILITLGGNDWHRARTARFEADIVELYNYTSQFAITAWIGPATAVGRAARMDSSREYITQTLSRVIGDHFLDSRISTGEYGRTRDGLHFTRPGARMWAFYTSYTLELMLAQYQEEGFLCRRVPPMYPRSNNVPENIVGC